MKQADKHSQRKHLQSRQQQTPVGAPKRFLVISANFYSQTFVQMSLSDVDISKYSIQPKYQTSSLNFLKWKTSFERGERHPELRYWQHVSSWNKWPWPPINSYHVDSLLFNDECLQSCPIRPSRDQGNENGKIMATYMRETFTVAPAPFGTAAKMMMEAAIFRPKTYRRHAVAVQILQYNVLHSGKMPFRVFCSTRPYLRALEYVRST